MADRRHPAAPLASVLLLGVLALLTGGQSAAASDPAPRIEGRWLTDDRKAVITIAHCGRDICGWISEIFDKGPAVPGTDIRNPDPRLRTRPLIGLPVLTGFRWSDNVWKNGRAYDPKTGKKYRSTLKVQGADRLIVTGCVLFLCESKYWSRVRAAAPAGEHP